MDVDRLYEQHHGELVRYLAGYTGDPEWATDVAHETYLRLLAKPPERSTALRAWMYKVATNIVRDEWRKRVVRSAPLDHDAPPDPLETLERDERRAQVRRALRRISPRATSILLMREQGFTHAMIASVLDLSPNSIGPLVGRALLQLERALREEPGFEP